MAPTAELESQSVRWTLKLGGIYSPVCLPFSLGSWSTHHPCISSSAEHFGLKSSLNITILTNSRLIDGCIQIQCYIRYRSFERRLFHGRSARFKYFVRLFFFLYSFPV
jgi:hypothetical protein